MIRIIILQAMRRALPGCGNELVYLIKGDTHLIRTVDDASPVEKLSNPMG